MIINTFGVLAEWFMQRIANPRTPVRFRDTPWCVDIFISPDGETW